MGYSENMSPDSASSLFPDRPIRPLPKRRLRERLSPDVAGAIKYPPAPQNIPPLFAYPYNTKEESGLLGSEPSTVVNRETIAELGQDTGLRRNGFNGEHHDETLIGQARRALVSQPFQDTQGSAFRTPQRPVPARHNTVQPPPSTTSSADGYDSFENTNNKKKRKIPTAGETILNGTHVLNDSSALGMPSPPTTGDEGSGELNGSLPSPYYQSGGPSANAQGISGPGRGRYGRVRNGRSPLRTLPDPNGAWNGRTPKLRGPGQYPSPPRAGENLGIISNAIATAEKLPQPQGQENISLLQQQVSTKSSPTSSTQFTFTFDSQNPVSWPGSDPAPSHISNHPQQHPTSASYRSSHTMGGQVPTSGTGPAAPARSGTTQTEVNATGDMGGAKGVPTQNVAPKKPKRRGNSLARAARERRQQTEYNNYLHPPTPEEFWLCEFCEYERIFGHPPVALIRQYEIKDRRRREEDANRKRLLDKAKSKSRKGKKASKSAAKNSAVNSNRTPAPPPLEEEDPHQAYYDRDNEYYQDDVDPRPEYYADTMPGSANTYETPGEWVPPPHPASRSRPST